MSDTSPGSLDFRLLFNSAPGLYLVLAPDLTIVAVSDAYLNATMTQRDAIVGQGIFDIFPDTPGELTATGVRNLRSSLDRVLNERVADTMAVQRYPIRRPESQGGGFEERFWSPRNFPVLGPSGDVAYIIHQVEDVTDFIRLKQHEAEQEQQTIELRARGDRIEAEVFQRAQEIQEANRLLREASEEASLLRTELEQRVRDRTAELTGAISEQMKSAEALRLRDRAIQAVSQGILISDPHQPDNPIIYASHGFERLTGYREAEILGRNCRMLQGPNTDKATVAKLREAIRDGKECSVEILNYRKDGTSFWNALFVTPIRDDDGRLLHFIGVQADVTERHKLEDQLHQSQKMDAVGKLAGGIAHDFNNLLTVISGYSEIVEGLLPAGEDAQVMVSEIRRASERATSLTRQLLAFSRQQVLEPRIVNLNAILLNTERMLTRLIGEDIQLTSVLAPNLASVKADPGQIDQVIMNLAVNARDAMPHGGKITIETRNVELDDLYVKTHPGVTPGEYVLLSLADTGCGMSPEVKARVFEPFFTTKGVGKGTGLGLSVVHGIVKQSAGHLDVYSEVGVGTVFKIHLPAIRERPASPSHTGTEPIERGAETLLLVEDDTAVRDLAVRTLRHFGYVVLEASNGPHALEVLEDHVGNIDLLVTDVVMPEMNGRKLAEIILAYYPQLRVLYVSGYTDDAVVRHGILEADFAFLQKPFTANALARKVREVLDL